MTTGWKRASGATTIALSLVVGGAIAPMAAHAEDTVAPVSGPEFDANAKELLADDDVQAVASDGNGGVVVYTTAPDDALDTESKSFIETNGNVVVERLSGPLTAHATNQVVGGAGYARLNATMTSGSVCSVGFSGWTPTGDPAIISAGHCNASGFEPEVSLTLPSSDPAGGGAVPIISRSVGEFGFSQFGGPGDTEGEENDRTSVDIAVIDVDNPDLQLLPRVTDWTTSASEDLAASSTPITEIGSVELGPVERSGRTTGHREGEVLALQGWARVSGHYVYGFPAAVLSQQGDSGGAVYQGTKAVGVVSGGTTREDGSPYMWAADLQAGLALTGGYTVALDIAEPVLTDPGNGGRVEAGAELSGTGPAGRILEIVPVVGDAFTVEIDDAGAWSFPAPDTIGAFTFGIVARDDGFNRSNTVTASVVVVPEAPSITSPADDSSTESAVTSITGTGIPGALVSLDVQQGDEVVVDADPIVVDDDGRWAADVDLGIGAYVAVARQTVVDVTSSRAVSDFAVVPVAPVVSTPVDGTVYDADAAPTSATGAGLPGATVVVSIDGTEVGSAVIEGSEWVVDFAAVAPGTHTLTATQVFDGIASTVASVTFTVDAAVAPAQPSLPSGTLPVTGVADQTPFAVTAGALLLFGAGLLVLHRRRRATR